MANSRRKKAELLEELEALRARVAELEAGCACSKESAEASAERVAHHGPVLEMEQLSEPKESLQDLKPSYAQAHGSEVLFRRLYESGLLAVIFWDMDGAIRDANDKFLQMVGYTREDLVAGRIDWVNMTPPEYRHLDEAAVKELKATGVNRAPLEKEYIRKDGSRVPILVAGAMLDEARFHGIAFVLDITERKQAEKAVQELNATLEQYVARRTAQLKEAQEWIVVAKEAANLGAFDFDTFSGSTHWDRQVRELWGVGPDEPVSFGVFMSGLHPDDRERTQAAVDRAFDPAGDGKYFAEYRVISRKDGATRWVAATGQTFFKDGRAVRLVGTVEDITERKISEQALAQQRELLQRIFDNVPVLLVIWDLRLQQFTLNHHAESVLGWTTREANDTVDFMSEVYPDPKYRAEASTYMRSLESGWREWIITTKNGERVPIDWANIHLTDDTMIGIGVDLRERKWAEVALRESETRFRNLSESLEETVRQKTDELVRAEHLADIGRMVATVAHEVRNPIQVIRAGVDTMRIIHNDENEKEEILEEVEYGAKMLEGTLSDLLQYARPLTLEFSFVPVKDVVDEALKLVADRFKRISMHIELERGDAEIHVDFVKLKQVLANVISNATDSMPGGGSLTILSKTSELGGEKFLQISISDTGHGINPDNLDDIFKPFFTTKARGTGLGLALCRRIMEAHCGDISVKSKVGEGTTVDLIIPLF